MSSGVIVDEGAMRRVWSAILVWVILVWGVGCSSLGPWSISRDRFDYTTAISDSWKDQMLMNRVTFLSPFATVIGGSGSTTGISFPSACLVSSCFSSPWWRSLPRKGHPL